MDVSDTSIVPATFQHASCVVEAAVESFATTCNLQLAAAEPMAAADPQNYAVLAVIALMGDLDWSLGLALPRETAVAVVGRFAGFEVPFESPDMGDAVGELANILGGTAKAKLDTRGVRVSISLPTVLRGQNVMVVQSEHAHSVRRAFTSPLGGLEVAIVSGRELVPLRRPGV
jgi:chemotaxis protein CheX